MRRRFERVRALALLRAVALRHRVTLLFTLGLFLVGSAIVYWTSTAIMVKGSISSFVDEPMLTYFRVATFSVPGLVAALVGAPMLASEYEAGTYRFSFTQGAGRRRVLLSTLAVFFVTVALGALIMALAISRFYHELDRGSAVNPWPLTVFFSQPEIFVGLVVSLFALGVMFGALVRRNVAAITTTIAALAVAGLATTARLYYLSLDLFATTKVTNDPGFHHHSTFLLFGEKSARALFSRGYVLGEWTENARGEHFANILSPSTFQVLHDMKHYTFWVQMVMPSRLSAFEIAWLAFFFVVLVVSITVTFARVGGRDRLLFASRGENSRAAAASRRLELAHGGGGEQKEG